MIPVGKESAYSYKTLHLATIVITGGKLQRPPRLSKTKLRITAAIGLRNLSTTGYFNNNILLRFSSLLSGSLVALRTLAFHPR